MTTRTWKQSHIVTVPHKVPVMWKNSIRESMLCSQACSDHKNRIHSHCWTQGSPHYDPFFSPKYSTIGGTIRIISIHRCPTSKQQTIATFGKLVKSHFQQVMHCSYAHWWRSCAERSIYWTGFSSWWNVFVFRNARTDKLNISTTSEYCLIREILFMFRVPTNCKFFSIVNDAVQVNDLVSLNSVSLVCMLHSFHIFSIPSSLTK